jgi:hypothetical protein
MFSTDFTERNLSFIITIDILFLMADVYNLVLKSKKIVFHYITLLKHKATRFLRIEKTNKIFQLEYEFLFLTCVYFMSIYDFYGIITC